MLPISRLQLEEILGRLDIDDVNCATIRQICSVADSLENLSQEPWIHLELGNPGLVAESVGVEAHCSALKNGVANRYPNVVGIKELKENASKFLKAFLDVDLPPLSIIPTVGSMQGSFTLMLLLGQRIPGKDTMLFIDPGFPAQHHQAKILGLKSVSFDIYDYRGTKLRDKLEEILSKGNITGIIYSNPNNPAWTILSDDELAIIGELATKYDAIVLEDLAYMGMDFRRDESKPYEPPFVRTVAKYTDNCILLVSASKIFSYAGERIALMCMNEKVFKRKYDFLREFYDLPSFGDAYAFGVLYTASSGVSHSAQHALAAMLGAAVEGKLNFVGNCRVYGDRANKAKSIFLSNGFKLTYEKDDNEPISDGFFFTLSYKDMLGADLQKELMRYGISTIPLKSTGSKQQGVRVTVSTLKNDTLFDLLKERLKKFNDEH